MSNRRIILATSIVSLLLLLVLGTPAPAQSIPPAEGEPWSVCADAPSNTASPSPGRTDYCIRELLIDGVSRLSEVSNSPSEGKWLVDADILDPGVVRWWVGIWEGTRRVQPPVVDISLTLDLGAIEPLYTEGLARSGNVVTRGGASNGFEIAISGRPADLHWKVDSSGSNCMVVACPGPDQANLAFRAFSGATQDMRVWVPEERETWKNTWRLHESQYLAYPVFSQETRVTTDAAGNQTTVTVRYWSINTANPHLEVDGDLFFGSFRTYLSAQVLQQMGTSAQEAAEAGLEIRWIEEGQEKSLAATVTATPDGGVTIHMPTVPYSSPTIKVSRVVEPAPSASPTGSPAPTPSITTSPAPSPSHSPIPPAPRCGSDQPNFISGTPGDDILRGTDGVDAICGFGGDDTIIGLGGNDLLLGGAGKDTIRGNSGKDVLEGGRANDILNGNRGNDVLRGGPGGDHLDGGAGRDACRGGNGRDRLLNCE